MVYKSLNGLAPQYMRKLFTRNSACNSRSLRNSATDLRLPMKTFANGQKFFSFRGAKLWNGLPVETRLALSLSLCLVSAGSGTEIYLWVFVVGLVGGGRGRESGWLLGRWGELVVHLLLGIFLSFL